MTDDARGPGRDSIDNAFAAVYGPAVPEHRVVTGLDGPGGVPGLRAVSAYRAEDRWHFVTLGLTDLSGPAVEPTPETSGLGHELTLITPAADAAPDWGFGLLLGAARTCAAAGRPFHAGARLAPGAPIDGRDSGLVALGLRPDPVVAPTAFPLGRYALLQAVGVTAVEYRLMQRAGTLAVLAGLARRDPLLRTDPARA